MTTAYDNPNDASTVIVTGGAGFIGSTLVRRLLDAEPELRVVTLDKLTYAGHLDSLAGLDATGRHHFVHGDIGDAALVCKLLAEHRPTAIFNLAAESHVDRSIDRPGEFLETNVVGTAMLLRAALAYFEALDESRQQAFRFVHVSTDEVYGSLGPDGSFTEDSPYRPNSPYSASKAASNHFVRAYHATYGLPTLQGNGSNNFGPRQHPEKLIPLMTLRCLAGEPLPIYGDGRQVRNWLHVADHADALIALWRSGRVGEVYNIGGEVELANLDIVKRIGAMVSELKPDLPAGDCQNRIEFVRDRPGHDRRYSVDSTKLQSETGWRPRVAFDEGLRETIRWYLENPAWVKTVQAAADWWRG